MRILLLVMLLGLAGCVTETTGGFSAEASPGDELQKRVALARQYIGEGDWDNAKRNLELAANVDPNNAEVYEAFGLVYQSTGEYELAEQSFRKALRVDPKLSRARNNYAAFLFGLGRVAEAEEQFERVTEDSLYSARPLSFINLGICRLRLDDPDGAEEAFTRSLSMDRRNPVALLEMGYLRLAKGDVAGAERHYGVYRTVVPGQSPRGFLLGIGIADAKGDEDAKSSYELALRNLYPDSSEYRQYRESGTLPLQ